MRNRSVDPSRRPILLNALGQWGLERDGVEAVGPALIELRDELMRDLKIPPFDSFRSAWRNDGENGVEFTLGPA